MTHQSQAESSTGLSSIPRHIAIIMDGNNRWAQAHGLSSAKGHAAGVGALREIVRACADYEAIDILTVFAFSSENWSRPSGEVEALMGLLLTALIEEIPELNENHVRMEIADDKGGAESRTAVKGNDPAAGFKAAHAGQPSHRP